ncbi:unnamed protein product [Linum trigynum]|uniref:Uncharacterized protein n=1 Tax=Linum trigynum TaxID=586398 RepID=A0AAV2FUM0_9ROSI
MAVVESFIGKKTWIQATGNANCRCRFSTANYRSTSSHSESLFLHPRNTKVHTAIRRTRFKLPPLPLGKCFFILVAPGVATILPLPDKDCQDEAAIRYSN